MITVANLILTVMENNPWELRADDARVADSLYTFVIFCEDEVSEYHYFKWFETELIKVNVIGKQKSMLTNITKAIAYCTNNGILSFKNGKYVLDMAGIELWSVYDRDIESNPQQVDQHNHEFNLAVAAAADSDIQLAWSNDAFELWVLLHIMDIDPQIEATQKRSFYYDQLTDYFRDHPQPNFDLLKALQHPSFGYKKDMKHKGNFINIVLEEILPHTQLAIDRAKALFAHHAHLDDHFQKKPCTLVHNLVLNLLERGKKQLPVQ